MSCKKKKKTMPARSRAFHLLVSWHNFSFTDFVRRPGVADVSGPNRQLAGDIASGVLGTERHGSRMGMGQ